jgi:hypothetical protein
MSSSNQRRSIKLIEAGFQYVTAIEGMEGGELIIQIHPIKNW